MPANNLFDDCQHPEVTALIWPNLGVAALMEKYGADTSGEAWKRFYGELLEKDRKLYGRPYTAISNIEPIPTSRYTTPAPSRAPTPRAISSTPSGSSTPSAEQSGSHRATPGARSLLAA
ncbi:hypothetical protein CONPUDRAFT_70932 [Coniophora puteana RWD-64-598 SS2]|uniref:Uncharacterized protein n=1 Tax=Coniophora puteana (strain RWD-64-598) TaxID=741705 RepID=A0A5M3MZ39_CONPW|nr:uncharacterized protein CONPUDRAFT_70932 [Coniophora puteana RWD-64-598 SS2]EIW84064.1 hypothetical protein CONPUDRAFT_70932 [Coniophora puteana RWD-64-598 SS2]